ncbi:unnamed protein product, partial [Adineta steineri]
MQKTTVHEVDERQISHNDFSNFNEDSGSINNNDRRQSTSDTSSPQSDSLPSNADFILVYSRDDESKNDEHNHNRCKLSMSPSERRERFQDYLSSKQGLSLKTVESSSTKKMYVKVQTPFKILLETAEKMRMRLPIEKIEETEDNPSETEDNSSDTEDKPSDTEDNPSETEDNSSETKDNPSEITKSCRNRFTTSLKRPFRLDLSLSKHDPDYYTAIYSSKIPKFKNLFATLRGSQDLYFTPSERSLLTYEL